MVCWGAVSKVASDGVDANTNQIFFTLGLVPLIVYVARSPRLKGGSEPRAGIGWALLTDILGGTGNIAFSARWAWVDRHRWSCPRPRSFRW